MDSILLTYLILSSIFIGYFAITGIVKCLNVQKRRQILECFNVIIDPRENENFGHHENYIRPID